MLTAFNVICGVVGLIANATVLYVFFKNLKKK